MTKEASLDHPVHDFIARRWSPYSFSDRAVPDDDVRSLFEAARWAASSFNEQPWSYIVALKRDHDAFERLLSCLVEGNQEWAKNVPVLAIGCTAKNFKRNGKPNTAYMHDLGLASSNLTFEATARGLYVHQMIGILPDRVSELYDVPADVQPLTGVAIGYLAGPEKLSEKLRPRDLSARQRKPLAEFVFAGKWGTTADLVK